MVTASFTHSSEASQPSIILPFSPLKLSDALWSTKCVPNPLSTLRHPASPVSSSVAASPPVRGKPSLLPTTPHRRIIYVMRPPRVCPRTSVIVPHSRHSSPHTAWSPGPPFSAPSAFSRPKTRGCTPPTLSYPIEGIRGPSLGTQTPIRTGPHTPDKSTCVITLRPFLHTSR